MKVKKGQLHISPLDKGKGIVAMDGDTYNKMAVKHTKEDIKVEWKDLELGEKEGPRNRARCYQNLSSWAGDAQ